jgi:protein TonB
LSALVGRHPLKQRYYRDVRYAVAAAVAIHAAVFLTAPPYQPRPFAMKSQLLRVVEVAPVAFDAGTGPSSATVGPVAPPSERVVANLPIRTEVKTAEVRTSPASAETGVLGSLHGDGGAASGTEEAGPPVFYSYDQAPQATRRVEPAYPPAARSAGAEGTVVVNLNLDERGRIMRAWVARANAPEILINAALDAAYQFEFRPGSQRGVPVKCTVSIPFLFTLRKLLQGTEDLAHGG